MSYTQRDAAAFERLLEVLRGARPYRMTEHLAKLESSRAFREIGLPGDIQVLATLLRSPRWKDWLRDYEQIRGALVVREALDKLPEEVARVMAAGWREAAARGADIAAHEREAAAKVLAPPAPADMLELGEDEAREILTGSLWNDTATTSASQDMAPPPPPPTPTTEAPDVWQREDEDGEG